VSGRRSPAPRRVEARQWQGTTLRPFVLCKIQKTQARRYCKDEVTSVLCAERLLLQLWPTSKLLESREQFWPVRSG
jgi:hypothetical protein